MNVVIADVTQTPGSAWSGLLMTRVGNSDLPRSQSRRQYGFALMAGRACTGTGMIRHQITGWLEDNLTAIKLKPGQERQR